MAWRDRYRPASFRGVAFHVDAGGLSGGRRNVQHEYPDRDTPYVEDLGRAARSYPVEGYVLGADYFDARDALLDALEAAGAGELVHPYHGARQVIVDTYRVRESSDEGGMARFSITFLEAGEKRNPSGTRDRLAVIDGQADAFSESALDAFVDAFSVGGLPAFVAAAASGQVGDLGTLIGNLTAGLFGDDNAAAYARAVTALIEDADNLVQSPADLGARVATLVADAADYGVESPEAATRALQSLAATYGAEYSPVARTTSTRIQQADNQVALVELVGQLATARATTTAARTDWATYDEAVASRDALAERLDQVMETTSSDDVYLEAQALRTVLVDSVPAADEALPRLSHYTPKATLPSLVLAYQLHGDASRSDALVSRNRVKHPGFVPGGDPLEILNG